MRQCTSEETVLDLAKNQPNVDERPRKTTHQGLRCRWPFWIDRDVKGEPQWHIHVRVRGVIPDEDCAILEQPLVLGRELKDKLVTSRHLTDGTINVNVTDSHFGSQQFPMFVVIREAVEQEKCVRFRAVDMVIRLQTLNECLRVFGNVLQVATRREPLVFAGIDKDWEGGLASLAASQSPRHMVQRGPEIVQTVADYWRPVTWRLLSNDPSPGMADRAEAIRPRAPVLMIDVFDGYVRLSGQECEGETCDFLQVLLCPSEFPLPTTTG